MSPFFYSVSSVFQDGLGYGDSSKPAYCDQISEVGDDFVFAIQNLLKTGHVLTLVSRMKDGQIVNDDGCGDGRAAVTVLEGQTKHRYSLHRPKVFGGGAMMATAMKIGAGEVTGKELSAAFDAGMTSLDENGVNYGAHTDSHADDAHCGCGAIDNAPLVLCNVARYRTEIRKTILALQPDCDQQLLDTVLDNFADFTDCCDGKKYSSKQVMKCIMDRGKVVKQLDGSHKELFILLNNVSGMTADQSLVRDVTGDRAQLFDVDVWRLKELAQALYDDEAQQTQAFLSELVYTLGVAATLTRGDLPVYAANPNPEFIPGRLPELQLA